MALSNYIISLVILAVCLTTTLVQAKPAEPEGDDFYHVINGVGKFKIHTRPLNWEAARQICREENAHLVIINTPREAQALMKSLRRRKLDSIFIGIHDFFETGDWTTILDDSITKAGYDEWVSAHGHCGILTSDGRISQAPCDLVKHFVCERPLEV